MTVTVFMIKPVRVRRFGATQRGTCVCVRERKNVCVSMYVCV